MVLMEQRGSNLAVPGTSPLQPGERGKLAFDSSRWQHLNRYISVIDGLPETLEGCSADTVEALNELRSTTAEFGSPDRLRRLVSESPNALGGTQPPSGLYARIVWIMQQLHASATFVGSTLQSLEATSRAPDDVKQGLQLLSSRAQAIRSSISPAIDSLGAFKRRATATNQALSAAFKSDADRLHTMQRDTGGLKAKADSLEKRIAEIGWFGAGRRRELEGELQVARQSLETSAVQSENLRTSLAKIEPILGEVPWVEPAIDELTGFLVTLRTLWTSFGSGLSQLVADASEQQLADPVWMKKVLGFDQAVDQWQAIDRAATEFTENSLVSFN